VKTPATETTAPAAEADWMLRLYIAGPTARASMALANLERICEKYLKGKYHLDVIDLRSQPELAREDQILATPTLVRLRPTPVRKLIGDLSNEARMLACLDLRKDTTA
jgi:circadian clock protein KaiB